MAGVVDSLKVEEGKGLGGSVQELEAELDVKLLEGVEPVGPVLFLAFCVLQEPLVSLRNRLESKAEVSEQVGLGYKVKYLLVH